MITAEAILVFFTFSAIFAEAAVRDKWAASIISPLSPSAIVVVFIDYQKLSSEQIFFAAAVPLLH